MTKNDGVYLTLGRNELLIHVPFRVIAEEIKPMTGRDSLSLAGFTKREKDVLGGVLQAKSNKEIAAGLGISVRTVKFYVTVILGKTSAKSRYELLARFGQRNGDEQ